MVEKEDLLNDPSSKNLHRNSKVVGKLETTDSNPTIPGQQTNIKPRQVMEQEEWRCHSRYLHSSSNSRLNREQRWASQNGSRHTLTQAQDTR